MSSRASPASRGTCTFRPSRRTSVRWGSRGGAGGTRRRGWLQRQFTPSRRGPPRRRGLQRQLMEGAGRTSPPHLSRTKGCPSRPWVRDRIASRPPFSATRRVMQSPFRRSGSLNDGTMPARFPTMRTPRSRGAHRIPQVSAGNRSMGVPAFISKRTLPAHERVLPPHPVR